MELDLGRLNHYDFNNSPLPVFVPTPAAIRAHQPFLTKESSRRRRCRRPASFEPASDGGFMSRFRLLFTALLVFLSLALPAAAQQVQPGLPLGRLDIISPC